MQVQISSFFGLLILLADIYAVLKIAQSGASDTRKVLWIAVVILLPMLGLLIWYLAGPKKP
ncbi:MAG: PLD nuclease N-terminal domain-containing protein [Woeseia sp.]